MTSEIRSIRPSLPPVSSEALAPKQAETAAEAGIPLSPEGFVRLLSLLLTSYRYGGEGALPGIQHTFYLPDLLRKFKTELGDQFIRVSLSGGAALHVIRNPKKGTKAHLPRDCDICFEVKPGCSAEDLKNKIAGFLQKYLGIDEGKREGGELVFRRKGTGQKMARVSLSGPWDSLLFKNKGSGLETLWGDDRAKIVVLTIPCLVNGAERNIDISLVWGEPSCRTTADSMRCRLDFCLAEEDPEKWEETSISSIGGYKFDESSRLLDKELFTVDLERIPHIRNGLSGYVHLLTSGLIPDKWEIETAFVEQFKKESLEIKEEEFEDRINKFIKRHYKKNSIEPHCFLHNYMTVLEAADDFPQKQPFLKTLRRLYSKIPRDRSIEQSPTLLFWQTAEDLDKGRKSDPKSKQTRYKCGHFEENGPRQGLFAPLPWEETLALLRSEKRDPVSVTTRTAVLNQLNRLPLCEHSKKIRLLQLICKVDFNPIKFAEAYLGVAESLQESEKECLKDLFRIYQPRFLIDLDHFSESVVKGRNPNWVRAQKKVLSREIERASTDARLEELLSWVREGMPKEEGIGHVKKILESPHISKKVRSLCHAYLLEGALTDGDWLYLNSQPQTLELRKAQIKAIEESQTAQTVDLFLDAISHGKEGGEIAGLLMALAVRRNDARAFCLAVKKAKEAGCLPKNSQELLLKGFSETEKILQGSAYQEALGIVGAPEKPLKETLIDLLKSSFAGFAKLFYERFDELNDGEKKELLDLLKKNHSIDLKGKSGIDFIEKIFASKNKDWKEAALLLVRNLVETGSEEEILALPSKLIEPNARDLYDILEKRETAPSAEILEKFQIAVLKSPYDEGIFRKLTATIPLIKPSKEWTDEWKGYIVRAPEETVIERLKTSPLFKEKYFEPILAKALDNCKKLPKKYFPLLSAAIQNGAIGPEEVFKALKKLENPPLKESFEILQLLLEKYPELKKKGKEFIAAIPSLFLLKTPFWGLLCQMADIAEEGTVTPLERSALALAFSKQEARKGEFLEELMKERPREELQTFLFRWRAIQTVLEVDLLPLKAMEEWTDHSGFLLSLTKSLPEGEWQKLVKKKLLEQLGNPSGNTAIEYLMEKEPFTLDELIVVAGKVNVTDQEIERLLEDPKIPVKKLVELAGKLDSPSLRLAEEVLKQDPSKAFQIALKGRDPKKWLDFAKRALEKMKPLKGDRIKLLKDGIEQSLLDPNEIWSILSMTESEKIGHLRFFLSRPEFKRELAEGFLLEALKKDSLAGEALSIYGQYPELQGPSLEALLNHHEKFEEALRPFFVRYQLLSKEEREQERDQLPKYLSLIAKGSARIDPDLIPGFMALIEDAVGAADLPSIAYNILSILDKSKILEKEEFREEAIQKIERMSGLMDRSSLSKYRSLIAKGSVEIHSSLIPHFMSLVEQTIGSSLLQTAPLDIPSIAYDLLLIIDKTKSLEQEPFREQAMEKIDQIIKIVQKTDCLRSENIQLFLSMITLLLNHEITEKYAFGVLNEIFHAKDQKSIEPLLTYILDPKNFTNTRVLLELATSIKEVISSGKFLIWHRFYLFAAMQKRMEQQSKSLSEQIRPGVRGKEKEKKTEELVDGFERFHEISMACYPYFKNELNFEVPQEWAEKIEEQPKKASAPQKIGCRDLLARSLETHANSALIYFTLPEGTASSLKAGRMAEDLWNLGLDQKLLTNWRRIPAFLDPLIFGFSRIEIEKTEKIPETIVKQFYPGGISPFVSDKDKATAILDSAFDLFSDPDKKRLFLRLHREIFISLIDRGFSLFPSNPYLDPGLMALLLEVTREYFLDVESKNRSGILTWAELDQKGRESYRHITTVLLKGAKQLIYFGNVYKENGHITRVVSDLISRILQITAQCSDLQEMHKKIDAGLTKLKGSAPPEGDFYLK